MSGRWNDVQPNNLVSVYFKCCGDSIPITIDIYDSTGRYPAVATDVDTLMLEPSSPSWLVIFDGNPHALDLETTIGNARQRRARLLLSAASYGIQATDTISQQLSDDLEPLLRNSKWQLVVKRESEEEMRNAMLRHLRKTPRQLVVNATIINSTSVTARSTPGSAKFCNLKPPALILSVNGVVPSLATAPAPIGLPTC